MQFGFRFQILLFTTSERFSTKTLAYLAYKAFKAFLAFKCTRLNPFQNYRSITSFLKDSCLFREEFVIPDSSFSEENHNSEEKKSGS